MASIQTREKNGKPSHTVKIRVKGSPPVFKTFSRLTDARNWAQKTESDIREGLYFKKHESRKHTLKELIKRYTEEILPHKPKVIYDYKTNLKWFEKKIGHCLLSDISPSLLKSLREELSNEKTKHNPKRTNASTNRYMACLSSMFSTAMKEFEWMNENPCRLLSKLPENNARVRFLDDDERERLLEACRTSSNKSLYLVVVLSLATGCRKNEIFSLRWDQIDLINGAIKVEDSKNNCTRFAPLKNHALDLIREHSKVRRIDTPLVFLSRKNPQKPIDFRKPWEKALAKAGIEDFRWHDLRHSCASYYAMNGATPRELAELLGHKTLQMVQRYSHFSNAHLSNLADDMTKKIFKNI